MLGLDDKRIAELFDINQSTIYDWQKRYPEFKQAMYEGRDGADEEIAAALFHRAKGYSHASEEIKVVSQGGLGSPSVIERVPITKHYPPDGVSIIFWLRNRQRLRWSNDPDRLPGGDAAGDIARVAREAIAAAERVLPDGPSEDDDSETAGA